MYVDLIQRVYWLKHKGDPQPFGKVMDYLHRLPDHQQQSFVAGNQQFFWHTFNSNVFEDFILEGYDWLYIHSADYQFEAVGTFYHGYENLIGQKDYPFVAAMWLLKSSFAGLETTDDQPIHVWLPHFMKSPYHRMQWDLKRIIEKLMDKKVPIKGTVGYTIERKEDRKIR